MNPRKSNVPGAWPPRRPACSCAKRPNSTIFVLLARVQPQVELAQPFLQRLSEALRVVAVLEAEDHVIRKADHVEFASHLPSHPMLDPQVQHVVSAGRCCSGWD